MGKNILRLGGLVVLLVGLGVLLGSLGVGLLLSCLGLLDEELLALGLGLLGVDGLHQHALVLVLVTLGVAVKGVVQVLVNLLGLAVLAEKATEHALPAHPQNLDGRTRVGRTLPLTVASVATLGLGLHEALVARLGVHRRGLTPNKVVLNQLANRLTAARALDIIRLVRVAPHAPLAHLEHRGREPLILEKVRGEGKMKR